ncbi:MAG: alpha-ketoacid dehydrogenase subunit beta [Rhodospirillaceae bacterium]|nr:alpha-ketoacid dehydrogenase subunit beta [Rhodospirillaceae bacterium]
MAKISYAQALVDGMRESMEEDKSISLVGTNVLGLGPQRPLIETVRDNFPDRVFDPPCSEAGLASLGIGAAMAGARPIIDFGVGSFSLLAWCQLVAEAGVAHHMSGGQIKVPMVFTMLHGLRGGGGGQHSHSPQAMLWNNPGIEIVVPSTPKDVKGLFKAAIASNNPTAIISHSRLLGCEGEVPEENYIIELGTGDIKRPGKDISLIASSRSVVTALEAAELLFVDGIEAEIVDLRTLSPLDKNIIIESVTKTGRAIVIDETNESCGVAAEISAIISESAFGSLKSPIKRISRPNVPVPASPLLEECLDITAEKIVIAARESLES